MQIKSRDDKFIISVADSAKRGDLPMPYDETQFDQVTDVYLEAIKGQKVTLCDVVRALSDDCFYMDAFGLHLLTESIKCHLTVGQNQYEFTVKWQSNFHDYLEEIVEQFKI